MLLLDIGTTDHHLARQLHGRPLTVDHQQPGGLRGAARRRRGPADPARRHGARATTARSSASSPRTTCARCTPTGCSSAPAACGPTAGAGHHRRRGARQARHARRRRRSSCWSPTPASSRAPGIARVCGPEELDAVVTNETPTRRRCDVLREAGVEVIDGMRLDHPGRWRLPGAPGATGPCWTTQGRGRVTDWCCTTSTRPAATRSAGCWPSRRRRRTATRPRVRATTDLDDALRGADFVFSAIRVGGLEGRVCDERVALGRGRAGAGDGRRRRRLLRAAHGAGGDAHRPTGSPTSRRTPGSSTSPTRRAWSPRRCRRVPGRPGDRHLRLAGRAVPAGRPRALGVDPDRACLDYAGPQPPRLAARACRSDGRDLLPELLADAAALASFEEGRLFGADWLRTLGAVPNEYLHYYYFNREAVAAPRRPRQTRGEFLLEQQARFYATARAPTAGARALGADPAGARDDLHGREPGGRRRRRARRRATWTAAATTGSRSPSCGRSPATSGPR